MSNNPLLDVYVNKSTKRWIETLLNKQYEQEKDGVNRNHVIEEMKKESFSDNRIRAFENCHKSSQGWICQGCEHVQYTPFSCNDRLCSVCSGYRKGRIVRRYRKPLSRLRNPKLITLSIGHIPIDKGDVLSHWRQKAYTLIRRLVNRKQVIAGFSVTEVSINWYWHLHIVIDTPLYIPFTKLSKAWLEISGRYWVRIQRCNPKKALSYILKYCVKSPEFLDSVSYVSYAVMTRNRRLFSTFGNLFAIRQRKTKPRQCPMCYLDMVFFWQQSYNQHGFLIKQFESWDKVP